MHIYAVIWELPNWEQKEGSLKHIKKNIKKENMNTEMVFHSQENLVP